MELLVTPESRVAGRRRKVDAVVKAKMTKLLYPE